MKIIKSTSFRSITTTSKIDGKLYVIPCDTDNGISVSDEVAEGFRQELLHEVSISDVAVEPESPADVPNE